MTKRKSTPFATAPDGQLFIKLSAVMNPLCAFADGLSLVRFGKRGPYYLPIQAAIEWCEKEMKYHSKEKYETMIAVMEKAKAQEAVSRQT